MDVKFEIVEEYVLLGEKRFRVKEVRSGIYFNVSASTRDEAIEKARSMFERIKADRVVRLEE